MQFTINNHREAEGYLKAATWGRPYQIYKDLLSVIGFKKEGGRSIVLTTRI